MSQMKLTEYANIGWVQAKKDELLEAIRFDRVTGVASSKAFVDRATQLAPPWVTEVSKGELREYQQGPIANWLKWRDEVCLDVEHS